MTTPYAPLYIPGEVCGTVGADPSTPPDQCVAMVRADVAADGVSAPPTVMPGLLRVVNEARDDGINLKIVVLDHNPPTDTPLRDIATVVGAGYPDATVLVLSPSYVGTYSTQYPRVTLEAGEDISKTGNSVVSAQDFLNALNTPEFPWSALTIVLLIGVLAAAVGTRVMRLRSKRSATSADGTGIPADDAGQGA